MPSLRLSLTLLVLLSAVAWAQKPRTEAAIDGFTGPVKSVSSQVDRTAVRWEQPGGPTMIIPIWCHDCEYDIDGSRTKSGQIADGKFLGQAIRLVRDSGGNVVERFATDASSGALQEHDLLGPFGKTDQIIFINGKPEYKSVFSYDQNGNMSEWRSFHNGKPAGWTRISTSSDGELLDRSVYRADGILSWRHTYDPDSKTEHFSTYDDSGNVRLEWTIGNGKLISFWEPSDAKSQFGDNFTEKLEDGTYENYSCHNDLKCDLSRVHYEYQNHDKHMPTSAEWRDAEGNLQLAAYFQYQVDSNGNWTERKVWVWNPSLGERTLYETDSRTITYWSK